MAEIVVTGGAGFLGSNLVQELILKKQDVCATYNYTPPIESERSAWKYLRWFRCDVTDYQQCAKLIMQENPKIVYHLVAQPIVTAAMRDPLLTYELTTRGTWNVLEAIRRNGSRIKAIVFVSSDKVYGANIDAEESDPLEGVGHPYNTAKIAADVISQAYVKSFGLPIAISRSANLYGPGDFHWDRVVPGVSRDLYFGRRPVIRSDGKQLRDYIHVSDGVRALMLMADAMISGSILPGAIFNFGSPRPETVLAIVKTLQFVSGRIDLEPEVLGGAKEEIDIQHIRYDRARTVLGWQPTVGLIDGLQSTYNWYRDWFK